MAQRVKHKARKGFKYHKGQNHGRGRKAENGNVNKKRKR